MLILWIPFIFPTVHRCTLTQTHSCPQKYSALLHPSYTVRSLSKKQTLSLTYFCCLKKSCVPHTGVFQEWAFPSRTGNHCSILDKSVGLLNLKHKLSLIFPFCHSHICLFLPLSVDLAFYLVAVDVFPCWDHRLFSYEVTPKACP